MLVGELVCWSDQALYRRSQLWHPHPFESQVRPRPNKGIILGLETEAESSPTMASTIVISVGQEDLAMAAILLLFLWKERNWDKSELPVTLLFTWTKHNRDRFELPVTDVMWMDRAGSIIRCLITTLSFKILTADTESAPIALHHVCGTTTYTPNSTYEKYLNLLLSSLSSVSAQNSTVFANAGQINPDIAYGFFMCCGDLSATFCHNCVAAATREVTILCPTQKCAMLWYDKCFLRYEDEPWYGQFGQNDINLMIYLVNGVNVTQQTQFQQVLGETMDELAAKASFQSPYDHFVKGFATQEVNFTSSQRIYELVQCTTDLDVEDCNMCLRFAINTLPNCCNAQKGALVLLPSCNVHYEINSPFYGEAATALPPPVPFLVPFSPPPSSLTRPIARGKGKISPKTIIAIAISITASVLLFVIGCSYMVKKSKKNRDDATDETDMNKIRDMQSLQFDLRTIQAATNYFSYENKIGEGGFGMVYKGTLANGQEIAAKRLSKGSRQGAKEFKNEVFLMAKLQHRNLVTLLGFCLNGDEKILVYEYVLNKSLDYFLFDLEKQGQLDWSTRYKIIGGIARGMLYLHEDSRLRIIHRDLKASNILLDANMNAKVSDFGIARIFGYAMHGLYSMRSDVFSFGVLVLEIISGKKNNSFYQSDRGEHLLSYDGMPLEFMDPTLAATYSRNEAVRCVHIGLLCVQEDADARPSMATIVQVLSNYTVSLPLPERPPFFFQNTIESLQKSAMVSVDEASITQVHPK
ncbi:hypothetical protein LguiA_002362 [Lonicera macranthoides]